MVLYKIDLENNQITLRTKEAYEMARFHLMEGSFWDYVAILFEEKVASQKVDQTSQVLNAIQELKQMFDLAKSEGNLGRLGLEFPTPHNADSGSAQKEGESKISTETIALSDFSSLGALGDLLARANQMKGEG